jgi:hypothetical protein
MRCDYCLTKHCSGRGDSGAVPAWWPGRRLVVELPPPLSVGVKPPAAA